MSNKSPKNMNTYISDIHSEPDNKFKNSLDPRGSLGPRGPIGDIGFLADPAGAARPARAANPGNAANTVCVIM